MWLRPSTPVGHMSSDSLIFLSSPHQQGSTTGKFLQWCGFLNWLFIAYPHKRVLITPQLLAGLQVLEVSLLLSPKIYVVNPHALALIICAITEAFSVQCIVGHASSSAGDMVKYDFVVWRSLHWWNIDKNIAILTKCAMIISDVDEFPALNLLASV